MISLIIAGGVYMAANAKPVEWPDIDNHTLKGEPIAASKVVCRTRWGTPMLPDGKGGFSLIAPINEDFIAESLIRPPQDPRGMVAYRPLPVIEVTETAAAPAPIAPPVTTGQPAPAPVSPDAPGSAVAPDASSAAPAGTDTSPFAPVPQ